MGIIYKNGIPYGNQPSIDATLTHQGEAADAKAVGDEISGVKNTLNHKADLIYDTASGDIASFPDGADGLPVKDLTVGIEPVQSGTGDPSPTNVRPISGWTGCNISHSGADTSDPTVIPIAFPSSAGTVYGGTLDVTTGVLTVTWVGVEFDGSSDENWSRKSASRDYMSIDLQYAVKYTSTSAFPPMISNIAKPIPQDATFSSYTDSRVGTATSNKTQLRYLFAGVTDTMNASEFKTWLQANPLQVAYELYQSQTYQLDPVTVTTLLGQNNIWADCGPSTVEYPADTKTYVDNGIGEVENTLNSTQGMIATVEPTSTASKSYAVGKLLVYNGTLYRVASPISSGGTFTPGTNIVATTVEAEIDTQEALINSNHSELYNWLLPMLVMDSDSLGEDQTYATTSRIVKRKKNHITIKYASDSTSYIDFSVIGADIGIYSKTNLNTYLTLPKTDNADLFLVLKYNEVSKGGSSVNTNTYRIRTWDGDLEHDEITKNYRPAGSGTITSTSGILIINISADLPEAITNGKIAFMIYSRNAKLEGDYYINVLALPKLPVST